VPCHLLIGYTHFPPVVPIFVVGIALSLVPAALWAAIPMMVPESRLGTAFGVVGYVQNVGLMLFPYLAGKIADAHTVTGGNGEPIVDYTSTMLMFAALGLVGFVFSLLLKWADRRRRDGISIEAVMRVTLHSSRDQVAAYYHEVDLDLNDATRLRRDE